jgi:Gas vesicle synthesis protein GvpL/GvpF
VEDGVTDGRYVYCVVDGDSKKISGKHGLSGADIFTVSHNGIAAVVSVVPYKEIESNLENIMAHQKVVEKAREVGTTLPVRFGIIFRTEQGVRELLTKQYTDYRAKLSNLKDKDEFGVKLILNEAGLKRIRAQVEQEMNVGGKTRKAPKAKSGTAYLKKIKMDEAIANRTYKKVDSLSREVHDRLAKASVGSALLKSEHEQIILNGAYLVDRKETARFRHELESIKRDSEKNSLVVHTSGPWAPYSFC